MAARRPSPRKEETAALRFTPILRLEERLYALEAAMPVCRAEPTRHAVHALRAAIRSVEAALAVIPDLPGMPSVAHEGRDLLRATARLRRRAGRIRDLDVFLRLLQEHEAELALDADDIGKVRRDCKELRRLCRRRRERTAARLVRSLERCETEVAAAAEALRTVCKPAGDTVVPVAALLRLAEGKLRTLPALRLARPGDEDLHEIRKAAKQARLAAELAAGDAAADAVARRLHGVQQAGGEWHDWMELAELAAGRLGRHRLTTVAMTARSERGLRLFEELIAPLRPQHPSGRDRKRSR